MGDRAIRPDFGGGRRKVRNRRWFELRDDRSQRVCQFVVCCHGLSFAAVDHFIGGFSPRHLGKATKRCGSQPTSEVYGGLFNGVGGSSRWCGLGFRDHKVASPLHVPSSFVSDFVLRLPKASIKEYPVPARLPCDTFIARRLRARRNDD